ncbi:neuroendocrine convertase 1-like [Planococcus citri]|uniref:neuroendocrine convertase 1-like n=1 Tax=Planococcus citri TaxID=170843 RepID=UPI0031F9644C
MHLKIIILLSVVVLFNESYCRNGVIKYGIKHYTNTWLVKISGGNKTSEIAKVIAEKENFTILEEIENFPGLFLFQHNKHPKKVKYETDIMNLKLYMHKEILWTQQITVTSSKVRCSCPKQIENPMCSLKKPVNDRLYEDMYYMHDCRAPNAKQPIADLNVVSVWESMGIYGKGVFVMVIDDGVETKHPDLNHNYVAQLGKDLIDGNATPDPEHLLGTYFRHGTECAGIIAAKGDNEICGVGIAPHVKWGAVRLHGFGNSSDDQEGKALSHRVEYVHISNNSWGPDDDGKTLEYLKHFQRSAFREGIVKGRQGRGTLYVFAAGNGRQNGDMCGYDSMANNIYTIVVAGMGDDGKATYYSERCSAVMITSYSENFVTTDINGKCTKSFTGTSAAAPAVSGVLALAVEANPKLYWRDFHHILIWTGNVYPLENNPGWRRNAAGLWLNHTFGFGLANAGEIVKMAQKFESVPPMSGCVIPIRFKNNANQKFSRSSIINVSVRTRGCEGLPMEIKYIENVELSVNIEYPRRGDLKIDLISPQGTLSHLIEPRKLDANPDGLLDWTIDTVHFWGESPAGQWHINVYNPTGHSSAEGKVLDLTLIIYGTKNMPKHYKTPRSYPNFNPPQTIDDPLEVVDDEYEDVEERT